MKIRELVKELPCRFQTAGGERICTDSGIEAVLNKEIVEITNDSRKVVPGSLFFCIIGANSDGHDFAATALEKGASALVVQKDMDLSSAVQETCRADEDHRSHRDKGQDDHHLYGTLYP